MTIPELSSRGPTELSSMLEGEGYIDTLDELSLALASHNETSIEDLAQHIIALAKLGSTSLENSELVVLEADISDVIDSGIEKSEDKDEPEKEPIHIAHSEAHRKKSKGLFKKIARGARNIGRAVRKIGGHKTHERPSLEGKTVTLARESSSKVTTIAHKIGQFIKKHKKELIIGAIIAAVVITGVILLAPSATAAGSALAPAAGGAGGSLVDKKKDPTRIPVPTTEAAPAADTGPVETFASATLRHFDTSRPLMTEVMHQAEHRAMEERFQSLVHPKETIEAKRKAADEAFDHFKSDLFKKMEGKEISDVMKIGIALAAIKPSPTTLGVAVITAAAYSTTDLGYRAKDAISREYEPIGAAYKELHQMESANRVASLAECERVGYRPKLEFHPTAPQVGEDHVALVDRNNPDPTNHIVVVMPEELSS